MRYLLVADIAKKWNMSERSVRNYCAQGRVNGAFLTGKTWNIPEKIGLLLVIIRNFRMKLAAGIQPFRKKLPIK